MKISKKLLSVLCAVFMVMAMAAPAFAADVQSAPDARGIAYIDTQIASPEQKADILAARREIIYGNQSWTVNGAVSIINADGSVTELPEFSELFPGWDLTEISARSPANLEDNDMAALSVISYGKSLELKSPSQVLNTDAFYRFNANGNDIYVKALTLPSNMEKYNVGFNNEDDGEDLGWISSLELGQKATLSTSNGVRYGVRASSATEGVKGYAYMSVSEDPDISL